MQSLSTHVYQSQKGDVMITGTDQTLPHSRKKDEREQQTALLQTLSSASRTIWTATNQEAVPSPTTCTQTATPHSRFSLYWEFSHRLFWRHYCSNKTMFHGMDEVVVFGLEFVGKARQQDINGLCFVFNISIKVLQYFIYHISCNVVVKFFSSARHEITLTVNPFNKNRRCKRTNFLLTVRLCGTRHVYLLQITLDLAVAAVSITSSTLKRCFFHKTRDKNC